MKNQPECPVRVIEVNGKDCVPLCDAMMPSPAEQEFGSVNLGASCAMADRFGLDMYTIDRDKSLIKDPLQPDSLRVEKLYLRACTDLGITEYSAMSSLSGGLGRSEVHGTHTLPACFSMAEVLLEGLPKNVEILKHQISAPIHNNLELIAYTGKNPNAPVQGKQVLYSHLQCDGTDIFIRGYETERPVIYVYDDAVIPSSRIISTRDLSPVTSANAKVYQQVMTGLSEERYSNVLKSSSAAAILALDMATLCGKEIIRNPELGLFMRRADQLLVPRQALFISRVQNFSCQDPAVLVGPELNTYVSIDLNRRAVIDGVELLPIDFQIHNQGKTAGGSVTVASVPLRKI